MTAEPRYPEYADYQLYQRLENSQNNLDLADTADGRAVSENELPIIPSASDSTEELGGFVFDAFAQASSASEYMNAPGSWNQDQVSSSISSRYSGREQAMGNGIARSVSQSPFDIAKNQYFEVSPSVNVQDAVSMHFLVQSTISAAKGFRVMSYDELEATQDQLVALKAQLVEKEQKLAMERKIKEATLSMARLGKYGGTSGGIAGSGSTDVEGSTSGRRSFLQFSKESKEKRRLSKQVEEEVEESNRQIDKLGSEIPQIRDHISTVETRILQHHVATLAVTHQSSESSSAAAISRKQQDQSQQVKQILKVTAELEDVSGLVEPQRKADKNNAPQRLDAVLFKIRHVMMDLKEAERQKKVLADAVFKLVTDALERIDPKAFKQQRFGDVKGFDDVTRIRPQIMDFVDSHMKTFDDLRQGFQRAIDGARVDKYKGEKDILEEQLAQTHMQLQEVQAECDEIRNEHFASKSDWLNTSNEYDSLKQKHADLVTKHDRLKESHEALAETFQILQQSIDDKGDKQKSELANNALKNFATRGHLNDELDALRVSYEANRTELERLEIENVDLRSSLQESEFRSKAEVTQLQNELSANNERVSEWKERCETLKEDLASVVKSLEDVTRQAVDYESERVKLEHTVQKLQNQLFKESNSSLDQRVSMIGTANDSSILRGGSLQGGSSEPLSVSIIRHEFRKIIREASDRHNREVKNLQEEKGKLERLLRSVKTSSYMATLSPETLSSLSAIEAA